VNIRSVRSTSSNVGTGSARDHQHRQRSSVATPLTVREQLCSESTQPAGHGRRLARLHERPQGRPLLCCKEERRVTPPSSPLRRALRPVSSRRSWLQSNVPFMAPHSSACYEEDAISSPPLLAPASPLQEEFPSVCIGHTELPRSSVILTTVNICYSESLKISISHSA
jgi:hypothetical protein